MEFALNFAAPLPFKGNEPASSLASLSTTKVHFRGVVESSSPKVLLSCTLFWYLRPCYEICRISFGSSFLHFFICLHAISSKKSYCCLTSHLTPGHDGLRIHSSQARPSGSSSEGCVRFQPFRTSVHSEQSGRCHF